MADSSSFLETYNIVTMLCVGCEQVLSVSNGLTVK